MEENNQQKKNRMQQIYQQAQVSFFNIMFELLKEKKTNVFLGCSIIFITFLQLIGHIFEPQEFEWKDQFFLNFIVQLCSYSRLLKAISDGGSHFFYWALIIFAILYILSIIGLLIYMNFAQRDGQKTYLESIVNFLRYQIVLLYWVFYLPFYESFISILYCTDGVHYIDKTLTCYQGIHIFYLIVCIIFLVLLFAIGLIIAGLYNETQPVQEDCLSRLESSFEVALVIYKSVVATFSIFCNSQACSWILITFYIIASIVICYQYYKQIPYYNQQVSFFCGCVVFTYLWISINALLMKLVQVNGHIVIIFAGIPLLAWLVKNLRENRIEALMKQNFDKLQVDIDALIQINSMSDYANRVDHDPTHRTTMIGIINMHVSECNNQDCPCKEEYELYDISTNRQWARRDENPHQDEIFLKHFIMKMYEESLVRFVNSPSIHIAFSFYQFKVMRNIHASLIELNIALKKKPSLQQQFTIFRYKSIIEEYVQQDHLEHKHVYPELSNVIEFERLFGEMQRAIEKVCNIQVEFWTHLTTVVPDLNILDDLGKKAYEASEEVDLYWNQLCKINPHYPNALTIYGEYLKDIRNHLQHGNIYLEKAFNGQGAKKGFDEAGKSHEILFSEDTAIIHLSGNKESMGKILKTSQGLSKVFGYSKTEVIGHSINILMPAIFAKKHSDFLERFFKTGRQIVFYQERSLFATHRNGHCFQMNILVKQMPNLIEGIQYVGMIKPIISDFDFMITDLEGVIDSFSKGMTSILGLTPNLFKDKDSQINIQILAPDLIQFFLDTSKRARAAKSKFREPGGDALTLIVPRDFNLIAKGEAKSSNRGASSGKGKANRSRQSNIRNRSPVFKQFLKFLQKPGKMDREKMPSSRQLLQQREYVEYERKKDVTCEIIPIDIKSANNDSLKCLVFKIGKIDIANRKTNQDNVGSKANTALLDNNLLGLDNMDFSNVNANGPQKHDNHFNFLKQASDSTQQDNLQTHFNDKRASEESPRPSQPPLIQKKTHISGGPVEAIHSGDSSRHQKVESSKAHSNYQTGESHKKSNKPRLYSFHPDQGQQLVQPSLSNQQQEHSVTSRSESIHNDTEKKSNARLKSKDPSHSNYKSNDYNNNHSSKNQDVVEEEENEDYQSPDKKKEEPNLSDVETPRMDVSGLKLDSAQKEKTSFLQDLKKQSFLVSDISTQRMEAVNISAIPTPLKPKERSDQQPQKGLSRSSFQFYQQEADKMVKKENYNNLGAQGKYVDDDAEEIDNLLHDMEEPQQQQNNPTPITEEQEETQKTEKAESDDEEEEAEEYDEEEEQEQEESQMKQGTVQSKQKSNKSKRGNQEDEEEEEFKASQQSSEEDGEEVLSNAKSSAQASSKRTGGEGKPLLEQYNNKVFNGLTPNAQNFVSGQALEAPPTLFKNSSHQSSRNDALLVNQTPQMNKNQHPSSDRHSQNQAPNELGSGALNLPQKKDTHKIRTNPKYRCVDDGSDEGEDPLKGPGGAEDYEALSSKELDFRETVLKFERKKKRKEKRMLERQQRKIRANNPNSTEDSAGTDPASTKAGVNGDDDDDDDDESQTKSSAPSDDDDSKDQASISRSQRDSSKDQPKNEGDGISSVTTKQTRAERNLYILRMAIDEKYIPQSIKNLRYAANIIFIILLLLAIIYYAIQMSLFDLINQNINNIHNSESRLSYIFDITLRTRTLILENNDYLILNSTENSTLYNVTIGEIRSSATSLKEAQTDLSLKTSTLSKEHIQKINPDGIPMKYLKYPNMPDNYDFTIWEAIMEIVVSAYRISTLPLKLVVDSHVTIFFVMQNCLNSVLKALKSSTDAILQESENNRQENMSIFLYVLIAASCSIFFSLLFLIPVINKVKKNKQEVLELFTHRNIEKHIDEQLKMCRNFIQMRLQQSNENNVGAGEQDIDGQDPNAAKGQGAGLQGAGGDKELENELNNNKFMKRMKKKSKGKKWKALNSDFGSTLLKFLIFISIIEGYFIANYLLSNQFLQQVSDLTKELKLLISRQPVQSFLLLIQKELIYSNGTALIEGEVSETYVPKYHELLYDEEEMLLDKFSANFDYHSDAYNTDFTNVIYSNICEYVPELTAVQTECEAFNQGILKKGIYSSVIKYWDFLRQINHDFMESNRTMAVIKRFLNEPRLKTAERMQDFYFKKALHKLVTKLEADIDYFFQVEYTRDRTIFIFYLLYIMILYYFIWRKFVQIMQNELWKTKSMLSILPTKLCNDIEEIRHFIFAHSSNDFASTSNSQ